MIRRLLLLLALGSQLIAVSAQTAKSRATLYSQIDSSLPSNSSGAITAATLRTVFKDTIASAYNAQTDGATQVQSDWSATTGLGVILNKPTLFSGAYADLTGAPTLFDGSWLSLTGKPTLFSGLASDLTGTLADARLSANVPLLSASNIFTGSTQTAPAWLLPTFTAATIATNQNGLGWDENGRVTIQTPIGALQFYQTGSPAVPVIYWPGKIISDELESNISLTTISATSITAPTGSEAIDTEIIGRSIMSPLSEWIGQQAYAGANGIPYVADAQGTNGSLEATDGVYFPQAVVSGQSTGTSDYTGRYRTATQVKSDLAIAATDLTATGTKDSTTYLRGDNTWATIAGGGAVTSVAGRTGAVTLTTADVSGALSTTTAASTYQPLNSILTALSTDDYSTDIRIATLNLSNDIYLSGAILNSPEGWGISLAGVFTGTMSASNLTTGTVATARLPAQTTASVRTVSANATILSTNAVVICTGAGGITLTLPAANANTPRVTQLEIINRTSGTVTLARAGSDLFEGDTTALITTGASWSITSDASANWYLY